MFVEVLEIMCMVSKLRYILFSCDDLLWLVSLDKLCLLMQIDIVCFLLLDCLSYYCSLIFDVKFWVSPITFVLIIKKMCQQTVTYWIFDCECLDIWTIWHVCLSHRSVWDQCNSLYLHLNSFKLIMVLFLKCCGTIIFMKL